MTAGWTVFLLLICCACFLVLLPQRYSHGRILAAIPAVGAFCWIYVAVDSDVAQDRGEYYRWYREAEFLLAAGAERDVGFTFLLGLFPSGLPEDMFGLLFSLLFIGLLLAYCYLNVRRGICSQWMIPPALLAILSDRQFLDLSVNATRSSVVSLLFLIGLMGGRAPVAIALCLMAAVVHGRMLVLVLLAYTLSIAFGRWPKMAVWILYLSMLVTICRLLNEGTLISNLDFINLIVVSIESESVQRGGTVATPLSISLAFQLILGVIVPIFVVLYSRLSATGSLYDRMSEMPEARMFNLAIAASVLVLLLYPDFLLVGRLLFLPIVILPFMMAERFLTPYALFKVGVVAVALLAHFG